MKVSVCIATYRRTANLDVLLADLAAQKYPPFEVIVVDNDIQASARPVIERLHRLGTPWPLHYDVQPIKNISLTRNRTVELAGGDWLAFIDDDERALPQWLRELMETVELHGADGALGPVVPIVPRDAPRWIRRGRFYEWPRIRTGRVVPANHLRFGNVVLRASLVKQSAVPFDSAYGLTGGEDGDLLTRLRNGGARIVWCDEAVVTEPIVPSRLSLRWLLRRSLRGGQDFARHFLAGRYGARSRLARFNFGVRAVAQCAFAGILAIGSVLFGRHASAYWLLKAAANAGKISVFFGWHYEEYGGAAVSSEAL